MIAFADVVEFSTWLLVGFSVILHAANLVVCLRLYFKYWRFWETVPGLWGAIKYWNNVRLGVDDVCNQSWTYWVSLVLTFIVSLLLGILGAMEASSPEWGPASGWEGLAYGIVDVLAALVCAVVHYWTALHLAEKTNTEPMRWLPAGVSKWLLNT
jgi:hypothetical protein